MGGGGAPPGAPPPRVGGTPGGEGGGGPPPPPPPPPHFFAANRRTLMCEPAIRTPSEIRILTPPGPTPRSLSTPARACAVSARPRARATTCGTLVSAAGLAQLVEQLSCKQQVIGSSPIAGSMESLTAASQPQPTSPVRVGCPGLVNEKRPATNPRPTHPAPPVADSRAKMASTRKSRDTRTVAMGARTQ